MPPTWKDEPSLFVGQIAVSSPAGYVAPDDTVYINPNCPAWPTIAEVMKTQHAQGWSSTDDPDHPTIHEIGHYAHRHNVGIHLYIQIRQRKFTAAQEDLVMLKVSRYAATRPVEFVAELFVRKVKGYPIPADVQDLYDEFGGPNVQP